MDRQPAGPKEQQSVQNNLQKQTEAKITSTNHKNNIKLLILLLRQSVHSFVLFLFVDFARAERAC